jgi:THAP4-like, heme-binding beta-barrel domain
VDATIMGARVELTTDVVTRTPSAKDYSQGQRLYGLVDGRLLWTFDMAAMGEPLHNHLAASLTRASGEE